MDDKIVVDVRNVVDMDVVVVVAASDLYNAWEEEPLSSS